MEKTNTGNREKAYRIYSVCLKEMEFFGLHGCLEIEKKSGNLFSVDFEGKYCSNCGQSDDLVDAVDYGAVYEDIKKIMSGPSRNLLETLASDILDCLLADFPDFFEMTIVIRKRNPPLSGPCKWSIVSSSWHKDG